MCVCIYINIYILVYIYIYIYIVIHIYKHILLVYVHGISKWSKNKRRRINKIETREHFIHFQVYFARSTK